MHQKQIYRWIWGAALLCWMGVIFHFSAQNGEESSAISGGVTQYLIRLFWHGFDELSEISKQQLLSDVTFVVRKGAHFSEYAMLAFLAGGFGSTFFGRPWRYGTAAWGFAVLYAVSDELHQMFSDGRSPRAFDVMVDSAGALAGIGVFFLLTCLVRHLRKRGETGGKQ